MTIREMIFTVMVRDGDMMSVADVRVAIVEQFGQTVCYGSLSGRLYELFDKGYVDKWETFGPPWAWTGSGFGERGGQGWTLAAL